MKFQNTVTVHGMKFSKGAMDNGTKFDSTKIYCLIDMDSTKGNAKGQAVAEYNIGLSDEFEKYKHLPFPFNAVVDFEVVTNGSSQKTIVTGMKPVSLAAPVKA